MSEKVEANNYTARQLLEMREDSSLPWKDFVRALESADPQELDVLVEATACSMVHQLRSMGLDLRFNGNGDTI